MKERADHAPDVQGNGSNEMQRGSDGIRQLLRLRLGEKNKGNGQPTKSMAAEQMSEPRFRNADNQDLWLWGKLPNGGDTPEVNGRWAEELPEFTPTSGELLALADHWTDVAIQRTFVEWADAPFYVSTEHWRRVHFAWRRVYRIRALLGDVVDRVIEDQTKKFHDENGGRWEIPVAGCASQQATNSDGTTVQLGYRRLDPPNALRYVRKHFRAG